MKKAVFIVMFLMPWLATAQQPESILLEYCYQQIETNYPLVDKMEVQRKITKLNQRIARSGLYPEVQLKASASYQSDVTDVPFSTPGTTPPSFSKDHYNLSLEVNQTIFDAGRTRTSEQLERGESAIENAGVKADLWKVRAQMEQVYFSILQLQKNLESTELLLADISEQLEMVRAQVENGVLLPGNALTMEAEQLKIRQQKIRIEHDLQASYEVLSVLIGEPITPKVTLKEPNRDVTAGLYEQEISRPELNVFEERREMLDLQKNLASASKLPVVSAFGTAAYGRPGLDMFNDDLQGYWMVGVRAQWSLKSWTNASKKTEVLAHQQRKIQADEEAFRLSVEGDLSRVHRKITQLEEQIELDEQVLNLREQVVEEKESQLAEGVITTTEYLTELNEASRARLQLELHRVQLHQTVIEYLTKKGISWN
ncbi:TolC family protein [Gracilimonas mengyeensis]|uniref:Outer membrane protein TolC n=1 Tax=Gracilimonas mengyeensis TaxID=1302730 RepID=A0A521EE27_9BACT|nr:TolC family protein [Gracilimonas mengyeensis]SMO81440.1 Outer membrane protein TolC [Gracilimonas mengyeensis]